MVMGVPMVVILFAKESACSLVLTLCPHLKAVIVVVVILTCFVSKFKYFFILLPPFVGEAFGGDWGALRASWLRLSTISLKVCLCSLENRMTWLFVSSYLSAIELSLLEQKVLFFQEYESNIARVCFKCAKEVLRLMLSGEL